MIRPTIRLRIDLAPGRALGPGKVDLLAAIAQTGSLSAAANLMRMSYKRAWLLLKSVNELFDAPLAVLSKGGRGGGGGATVTERGLQVVAAFRSAERSATLAAARAFDKLHLGRSPAPPATATRRMRPKATTVPRKTRRMRARSR